jgi:hypothetical protein
MIRITPTIALAALAALAGAAQAQTTTDEARDAASRALAEQSAHTAFVKPQLEPVAPGDYRAQAHNEARDANYRSMLAAITAYGAGVRSQPIAVTSEDSARAEAARVGAEQQLAELHTLLQTSAQARHDMEEGMQASAKLAKG